MTQTKIVDYCLFYGFPSVAICSLSLVSSLLVAGLTGQDSMVKWITFIGCNALLWFIYLTFQNVLVLAYEALTQSIAKRQIAGQKKKGCEDTAIQPEAEQHEVRRIQFRERTLKAKAKVIDNITAYIQYVFPPFVSDESLNALCHEVQSWTNDCSYYPNPIRLTAKLTTLDLRHFVWNIAERLGQENGYNGTARATFIKALFPDVFKDMELDSIRNFTKDPDKGVIVLQTPTADDRSFHIPNIHTTIKPDEELAA